MVKYKQFIRVLLLFTLLPGAITAQNNTNSPYTRYGYGQLSDQLSGKSKAMGGIAYGLRDSYHINPSNPASYTAVDSLTFLFEAGLTLQNTNFSDGTTKLNAKNSSFDYVTMQFRLHRKLAMTLGLLPFSNVGYNLNQVTTENSVANTITFSGEGGTHQLFAGLGFKLLKNLSIGANLSYFWGDITRTTSEYFSSGAAYSYEEITNVSISDLKTDFGLQYTHKFGKKNALIAGMVFSPKRKLNNDTYVMVTTSASSVKDTVADFGIPLSIGGGLTYVYDDRLTVGVDYRLEKWSEVSYMNDANAFCNRSVVALGAEYLPGYTGRNYFSLVKYRLGAYYSLPYYNIRGIRAAKEYGITGGFALPLPRARSLLSVSVQYIKVNGQSINTLDENYLRLNIGLTFNERWFFKRRVD
ncbi:hypothetical protein EZS27_017883 [termite gut metagenome]|uniref:Outer membrane protein n=1 Tax=termite gut metagenome TaxID=433724 RepID=A0A5J4RJK7_9ZZZZ